MVKQKKQKEDLRDEGIQVVSFTKYTPSLGHKNNIRVYKNTENGKQKQRIVSVDDQNVQHIAKNFGDNRSSKAVKYAVILRDPVSGCSEYIEIPEPMILKVRAEEVKPKFQILRTQYDIQHKKRLVNELGTNKSKRKLNQMMSNVIE